MPRSLLRALILILVPALTVDPALPAALDWRFPSKISTRTSPPDYFAQQALSPGAVGAPAHAFTKLSRVWLIVSLVALGTIWPAALKSPKKGAANISNEGVQRNGREARGWLVAVDLRKVAILALPLFFGFSGRSTLFLGMGAALYITVIALLFLRSHVSLKAKSMEQIRKWRKHLELSGAGVLGLAFNMKVPQVQPPTQIPFQTNDQFESMKQWAIATHLLITSTGAANRERNIAAMQDAMDFSLKMAETDPGWNVTQRFFMNFWKHLESLSPATPKDEWHLVYTTLIQDFNDRVLIPRGWLMLADTAADEGFRLTRLTRRRDVTATYTQDQSTHRDLLTIWFGGPVDLGYGAELPRKGSAGTEFGHFGRNTIFIEEQSVKDESQLLYDMSDPDSATYKAMAPIFRNMIIAAMRKDGILVADPKQPGGFRRVGNFAEMVEHDMISHEIAHAMKSSANEAVAYMTQMIDGLGFTWVTTMIIIEAGKAISNERSDPELLGILTELTRAMGDEKMAEKLDRQDISAFGAFQMKTILMSRPAFVEALEKARAKVSINLPGPKEWTLEYGTAVPVRPVAASNMRAFFYSFFGAPVSTTHRAMPHPTNGLLSAS